MAGLPFREDLPFLSYFFERKKSNSRSETEKLCSCRVIQWFLPYVARMEDRGKRIKFGAVLFIDPYFPNSRPKNVLGSHPTCHNLLVIQLRPKALFISTPSIFLGDHQKNISENSSTWGKKHTDVATNWASQTQSGLCRLDFNNIGFKVATALTFHVP